MEQGRLGEMLLKHRIISEAQLEQARRIQTACPSAPLGQILCRLGYMGPELLGEFLDNFGKRPRLGEVLVRRKVLTPGRLEQALAVAAKNRTRLGATLLAHRIITEEQLARAVADQHDLPFVSLVNVQLPPGLTKLITASYAQAQRLVPIATERDEVTIAVAFPPKRDKLRHIESCAQLKVKLVIARESEIIQVHRRLYKDQAAAEPTDRHLSGMELSEDGIREPDKSTSAIEAVRIDVDSLVKKIIGAGIRLRASDIHFESTERGMNVRFRIDGLLQHYDLRKDEALVNTHARQIVSKIKVLCDMDIAERRRPQDSSFKMLVTKDNGTRTVDFRVSTVPTNFGESVVIRVLDKRGEKFSLESLGYAEDQIEKLHAALDKPTGIFLVTGPTGSGKSSTLYALLNRLNTPDTKTLTVEDPIEYSMDGVTQTEVNEAIGNTFADMLRAFLRQDPDNIMLGEIRDGETATIAVRAAMTGHTVLSTLHTNDATSAITRLIDIGVEPNLLITTLRCVLAQRLARRVCERCRQSYVPSAALRGEFSLPADANPRFYRGNGCPQCNFTGYAGRLPITELWLPTHEELLMLNRGMDNLALRREVFAAGKRMTLVEDGLQRVFRGETTLEELMRVVPHEQITHCRDNVSLWLRRRAGGAA